MLAALALVVGVTVRIALMQAQFRGRRPALNVEGAFSAHLHDDVVVFLAIVH